VKIWGFLGLFCSISAFAVTSDIPSTPEVALPPLTSPYLTSKDSFPLEDLNFGVLIYNSYYKIYRSSGMGVDGLSLLKRHLETSELSLPTKIIHLNFFGFHRTLASSWMANRAYTLDHLQRLWDFAKTKIGRVQEYALSDFASDQEYISKNGNEEDNLFRFEFLHGGNSDVYLAGSNPMVEAPNPMVFYDGDRNEVIRKGDKESVFQVLKEILTSEGPVQFHCKGGLHRTGMVALLIRYLQGGRWMEGGLPEIKKNGVSNLAEYEYFLHNRRGFRKQNLKAMRTFVREDRFKCLQDRFSCFLNSRQDARVFSGFDTQLDQECGSLDRMKLWESCSQPESDVESD
jgi:protein-tyrosine phosphatase